MTLTSEMDPNDRICARHCKHERFCKCERCKARVVTVGLPVPFLPADKLRSQLEDLSSQTSIDQQTLAQHHRLSKAEIKRKWSTMRFKERKQLLNRADIDMPEHHRPELDIYDALVGNGDLDDATDLCHADNLLLVLEARPTQPPGYFAVSDLEQAGISVFGHDLEQVSEMVGVAVSFPVDGTTHPDDYSKLVSQADLFPGEVSIPPDVGFMACTIHASLYSKLARITEEILNDSNLAASALKARESADMPNLTHDPVDTSDERMQAPFRGPVDMDHRFVRHLVSSKANAALTRLLLLREAPPFLSAYVQEWADHYSCSYDAAGKKFKDHVSAGILMVDDAYKEPWYWHAIEETLGKLEDVHPTSEGCMDDWLITFQELQEHLEHIQRIVCERVVKAIPSMSTFGGILEESSSTRVVSVSCKTIHDYKPKEDASSTAQRIIKLFNRLCSDNDRHVIRPHNLVQEISHLMKTNTEASLLMTDWLGERFSDIADIVEVQYQLSGWQPYATLARSHFRKARVNNEKTDAIIASWKGLIAAHIQQFPIVPGSKEFRCSMESAETQDFLAHQYLSCGYLKEF